MTIASFDLCFALEADPAGPEAALAVLADFIGLIDVARDDDHIDLKKAVRIVETVATSIKVTRADGSLTEEYQRAISGPALTCRIVDDLHAVQHFVSQKVIFRLEAPSNAAAELVALSRYFVGLEMFVLERDPRLAEECGDGAYFLGEGAYYLNGTRDVAVSGGRTTHLARAAASLMASVA